MISDQKLATVLSNEASQAVSDWQSDIGTEQVKALKYYIGERFEGDDDPEMDTWSKVISRDVAEVVDWSLPEISFKWKYEPVESIHQSVLESNDEKQSIP